MLSEELKKAGDMITGCKELGEWNLQYVVLDKATDLKRRIDNLKKPKSLYQFIAQDYFVHVIEDFGFYKVFRFEKRPFAWLREAMEVLQHLIIISCVHASVTPRGPSASTRCGLRISIILLEFQPIDVEGDLEPVDCLE